jgi:hypothetical protein
MFLNLTSRTRNKLLLLAPAAASLETFTGKVISSEHMHSELLADAQRLRGRVYLDDAAIGASELTSDGRHISALDEHSWHLLTVSASGRAVGCTRFRQYPNTVNAGELCVSKAPLAKSAHWGPRFLASIDSELHSARSAGFPYVEVGGWALDREIRGTSAALNSVLATYAWSQLQGGALGVSTATERNGSAAILRRLGGSPLEHDGAALPAYYDESYKCMMEVLRFDSRNPNRKYAGMIQSLADQLSTGPIVRRAPLGRRPARVLPAPSPAPSFHWLNAFEATA